MMIKFILKSQWNGRRQFYGIFFEQMFIFIILMILLVSIGSAWKKYREPGMLNTNNVVLFGYMINKHINQDEIINITKEMSGIIEKMKFYDYVKAITEGSFMLPYLRGDQYYEQDTITIDGKAINVFFKGSDHEALNVLSPDVIRGEWIINSRMPDGSIPVVITKQLADVLGWYNPLKHKISHNGQQYSVVGVISGLKHGVFKTSVNAVIYPLKLMPNVNIQNIEVCARVKSGEEKTFIADYYKEFKSRIKNEDVIPIMQKMEDSKNQSSVNTTLPLILLTIPTLFILIFSFIAIFGIFFLNTKKRTKEFALLLCIGSTKLNILLIVMVESLIITLFACIPGLIISFFIYDYLSFEGLCVIITLFLMILFSVLSVFYPANNISKITPSTALKSE